MAKKEHGGFTRIELTLDQCGGSLTDIGACEAYARKLIAENDMQVAGCLAVPCGTPGNSGFQIHLVLLESFVIIEGWPEINRVKIIVDICDYNRANGDRALRVADGLHDFFDGPELLVDRTFHTKSGILIEEAELARRLAQYN